MTREALITETFSSFQGEGLFAGRRQFFVRLTGCNLPRCRYCDTRDPEKPLRMDSESLVRVVADSVRKEGLRDLTLTGGEPLLQADFLMEFLNLLSREVRLSILLETNATLAGEMSRIAPLIHWVSADYKLSSVTGEKPLSSQHESFFRILEREKKEYYIKAVVSKHVDREEFSLMCRMVSSACPGRVLFLQPMMKGRSPRIKADLLEELYFLAVSSGIETRIMPQIHKILNFR